MFQFGSCELHPLGGGRLGAGFGCMGHGCWWLAYGDGDGIPPCGGEPCCPYPPAWLETDARSHSLRGVLGDIKGGMEPVEFCR